ncbi:MAG: ROK family protein, partial [Bacillota bacterium]
EVGASAGGSAGGSGGSDAGAPTPVAAGLGAPGPLDLAHGCLLEAPNLPGWSGFPVVRQLWQALGLPVVLENDANAAAIGEHRFGAAAGLSDFLYVTLGTGIGGAVFMDGRLRRGTAGGAGEIGHLQVDPNGPPCGCGRRGCVEVFAAGPGLARAAGKGRAEEVFAAAAAGDDGARDTLRTAGRALGRGLAFAVTLLDPQAVVIGGGLAGAAPEGLAVYLEAAGEITAGAFIPGGRRIPLVRGALGPDAGALGAAALAMETAARPASRPPKVVDKPWGREIWWAQTDRYVGKIIEVRAGASLSLQYHRQKLETMLFVDGQGMMQFGDEIMTVTPGRSITISPGTLHRVSAVTDLRFYEVSTPEVEDVVRVKDDFGRA